MSKTVSRGRGRRGALGVVLVVAAGAVAAGSWWAGSSWAGPLRAGRAAVFSPAASSGSGHEGAPPATRPVVREDLIATTPVTATLGYAGSYPVTGQGGGTLTWLPAPGQVIRQGQALYRVDNGSPVVLLYGSVPDWRALGEGMTGQDVAQLNHDLVGLGLADRSDVVLLGWDYYSSETASGVRLLEQRLGVSWPLGSLDRGQVVFEPEALRVSQLTGSLGGSGTGPVLAATSDRHVVTIALDASAQSQVQVGDRVTVTLPDGAATPGVVSSMGVVSSAGTGSSAGTASGPPGSGGPSAGATIPVQVTLTHPQAAGTLDQAPVTVYITTVTARNVLAVPVTALVAQATGDGEAGGGYEVEVAGPGNTERWVPVRAGPVFDDSSGLVQVTGALTTGERVVVASS